MTEKLLRMPSVQQLYPMSRAHIYAEQKAGRFPKGIRIGKRAVAWKESDIQAFIESKAPQSLPPAA